MRIIIAGAGGIGFHLAQHLSKENQDIILIDSDEDILDYASKHLDVITLKGDASSISLLKEAQVEDAKMMIAVTTQENTNLICATMAKKLGAKITIARVNNPEYLYKNTQQFFKQLGINALFSPSQLASQEIDRLISQCSLSDIFDFDYGKLSLIGIYLDPKSLILNKTILELAANNQLENYKPIAILRGNKTIIPRANTHLREHDHLYFLTQRKHIHDLLMLIGKEERKVKTVMIAGASDVAIRTAEILEKKYRVSLIAGEKVDSKRLSELLPDTLILKGDPADTQLLREEGLGSMDVFVAATDNTETNILISLLAKEHGVYKTISMVENVAYMHLSQNIGVDTLINKKIIAANNILKYVRKGKIEEITALHGVDAEVIEFVIERNSRLTKIPLKDLDLPQKSLVGGIIRGDQSINPVGETVIQKHDKVIVFAMPEALAQIEKIFR